MNGLRRWIAYDTFKLIVALILLVLLLILYLQRPALAQVPGTGGTNQVLAGEALQPPSPTAIPQPTTQPTVSPAPPTPTIPPLPSPTATIAAPTPTATTALPSPTAVPTTAAAPQAQTAPVDCPLAAPSRLVVGKQASVITNLNLRKDAGMDKPILLVILPNAKVDVTGGPVCISYQTGAYLWWNVKTKDGTTGWSAEASLSKSFYFLQPVP